MLSTFVPGFFQSLSTVIYFSIFIWPIILDRSTLFPTKVTFADESGGIEGYLGLNLSKIPSSTYGFTPPPKIILLRQSIIDTTYIILFWQTNLIIFLCSFSSAFLHWSEIEIENTSYKICQHNSLKINKYLTRIFMPIKIYTMMKRPWWQENKCYILQIIILKNKSKVFFFSTSACNWSEKWQAYPIYGNFPHRYHPTLLERFIRRIQD